MSVNIIIISDILQDIFHLIDVVVVGE